MTETLLGLIPTYGLAFVFATMILSCLALPIPAAILIMTAGGFAASGDLALWQVTTAAYLGYGIGDQLAFQIARVGGRPLLGRAKKRPSTAKIFTRAETLLARHGTVAVFLSRTILSPLSPYVGYLSGALGVNRTKFTLSALCGAAIWCVTYTGLGYVFASRIAEISSMISSALGFILAGVIALGLGGWLNRSWRKHQRAVTEA